MDCDCQFCVEDSIEASQAELILRELYADPEEGWPTEGPDAGTVVVLA